MKIIIKLCLCLLVIVNTGTSVFGQENIFFINGKIKDSETKEILRFATIEVKTDNDSLYHSLISDSEGEFTFKVGLGAYHIKIHYLGYKVFEIPITINNEDIFLGNLYLTKNPTEIGEVQITASNYKQEIDREVHIVTKEMKAGTTTVKTLLNRVKGVSYDPIGNNIKVNNDSKVLLLVDGLEKEQEFIKNLNPERVSRIELLKEPGGKYASEGYSSIINIILKKNYSGYDITLDERAIFDLKSKDLEDVLAINNLYSSFNYTNKKLNIYGSYSNDRSNFNLLQHENKTLNNIELIKSPPDENNANIQINNISNQYTLGADYHINLSHIISIENTLSNDPHNTYSDRFIFTQNNNQQSDGVNSLTDESNFSNNYTSQLSYLFHDEKNEIKVNLGYNYYEYSSDNNYFLSDTLYFSQENLNLKNYTKLDLNFKRIVLDNLQLEVGYSGTWKNTKIESIYNEELLGKSLQDYSRNLAYTYLVFSPNEKISSKFGLSGEYSIYSLSDTNYSFINYLPLLNVQYKVNNKTTFTIKYRSSGEYPGIEQLTPYPTQKDLITGEVGNPSLSPSNLQKVSLNIGLLDGGIDIEPYYSFNNSFIDKTGEVIDDMFFFTYVNIDRYRKFGTNLAFEFNFLKTLYWNTSTDIYWSEAIYGSYENSLFDWSANSSILYYYPKYESIIAVMLKKENVKNISAYGYYTNNNDYLALYFNQPFFKGLFNLSILYTLPVDLGLKYTIEEKFAHIQYNEYRETDVSLVSNLLMINLTFRLNNMRYDRSIEKKDLWEDESKKRGLNF